MKSKLAYLLSLTIFLSLLAGCTNRDVFSSLDEAQSYAHDLAISAPQSAEFINKWSAKIDKFKLDFQSATEPGAQAQLLPVLTSLVKEFQSEILPLAHLNPLATAGIDIALRFVVNHFVKTAKPVVASVRSARANSDIDVLENYLKTPALKKPK
ncbi:MAG TPA: hypothetical protein VK619_10375 [Pyrinomonadaceae bacterium]|nr:hypothetical protein [Pyrinomonadaceae bacterium]